jgi:hypothetical protein
MEGMKKGSVFFDASIRPPSNPLPRSILASSKHQSVVQPDQLILPISEPT